MTPPALPAPAPTAPTPPYDGATAGASTPDRGGRVDDPRRADAERVPAVGGRRRGADPPPRPVAGGRRVTRWRSGPCSGTTATPETVEVLDGLVVRRFPMPLPARSCVQGHAHPHDRLADDVVAPPGGRHVPARCPPRAVLRSQRRLRHRTRPTVPRPAGRHPPGGDPDGRLRHLRYVAEPPGRAACRTAHGRRRHGLLGSSPSTTPLPASDCRPVGAR